MSAQCLLRSSSATHYPSSTSPRSSGEIPSHYPFRTGLTPSPDFEPDTYRTRCSSEADKLESGKCDSMKDDRRGFWGKASEGEGEAKGDGEKWIKNAGHAAMAILVVVLLLFNVDLWTGWSGSDDGAMQVREVHLCLVEPSSIIARGTWKVVDQEEFDACVKGLTLSANTLRQEQAEIGEELIIERDEHETTSEETVAKFDETMLKDGRTPDIIIGEIGSGINAGFGGPWSRVRR